MESPVGKEVRPCPGCRPGPLSWSVLPTAHLSQGLQRAPTRRPAQTLVPAVRHAEASGASRLSRLCQAPSRSPGCGDTGTPGQSPLLVIPPLRLAAQDSPRSSKRRGRQGSFSWPGSWWSLTALGSRFTRWPPGQARGSSQTPTRSPPPLVPVSSRVKGGDHAAAGPSTFIPLGEALCLFKADGGPRREMAQVGSTGEIYQILWILRQGGSRSSRRWTEPPGHQPALTAHGPPPTQMRPPPPSLRRRTREGAPGANPQPSLSRSSRCHRPLPKPGGKAVTLIPAPGSPEVRERPEAGGSRAALAWPQTHPWDPVPSRGHPGNLAPSGREAGRGRWRRPRRAPYLGWLNWWGGCCGCSPGELPSSRPIWARSSPETRPSCRWRARCGSRTARWQAGRLLPLIHCVLQPR